MCLRRTLKCSRYRDYWYALQWYIYVWSISWLAYNVSLLKWISFSAFRLLLITLNSTINARQFAPPTNYVATKQNMGPVKRHSHSARWGAARKRERESESVWKRDKDRDSQLIYEPRTMAKIEHIKPLSHNIYDLKLCWLQIC